MRSEPRVVSFRNEVVPVLTKLGCNQGACHGGQHGKGGFKLSLLGFEPEPDYTAIVKSAEERRVTPFAPEESLLLLKPTLAVAHGGGKRLEPDSPAYRLLTLWLEQGAPGPRDDDPRVVGVKVYPDHRLMEPGQEQRLVVVATLSDGTERDVTDRGQVRHPERRRGDGRPGGLARTVGQGEANIMVRYQGHAAMARLTVPFAREKPFDFPLEQHHRRQGRRQVARAGAGSFAALHRRRVPPPRDARRDRHHADAGRGRGLPRRPRSRQAGQAGRPPARSPRVRRLLDAQVGRHAAGQFREARRPGDAGVQSLAPRGVPVATCRSTGWSKSWCTAQGSIFSNGPANYFRVASSPDDLAETTAQVFMGVRLQCAKCHHHPFEAYGQDDYYGLAAYFAGCKTKPSDEFGLFGREQVIYVAKAGEVYQPRTGKKMAPRPLGDAPADDPVDRRRAWRNG